jgi:hypothetical protein
MYEPRNENEESQQDERSNQRTNQEKGNNDLNPTDRDEKEIEREFDLDEDKERKVDITSKVRDPSSEIEVEDQHIERSPARFDDPNINAELENRRINTGTMRNQP